MNSKESCRRGYVITHFGSWYYPDGTHTNYIILIPWVPYFSTPKLVLSVSTRIFDSDWYKPAYIEKIADGEKKANPYRKLMDYNPSYLNKLSLRRYLQECR